MPSSDTLDIFKIKIPKALEFRKALLNYLLYEEEEVSYRTLFPDLGGHLKSLQMRALMGGILEDRTG